MKIGLSLSKKNKICQAETSYGFDLKNNGSVFMFLTE